MASGQSSRSGLVVATVVSVIVAVAGLVLASIFAASANKATKEKDALQISYREVIDAANLQGPELQQLRDAKGKEPFTGVDKLISVALGQRDQVSKLLSGGSYDDAVVGAHAALEDAAAKLEAAKLPPINKSENVAGALRTLAASVSQLSSLNADLIQKMQAAQADVAGAEARTKTTLDAKEKQIEGIRAEQGKTIADYSGFAKANQGTIDDINKNMEAERKTASDALNKINTDLADAKRNVSRLSGDRDKLLGKLENFTPNANASTLRKADGKLIKVTGTDLVYIDLGEGKQVLPGMSFEVYDQTRGVPPVTSTGSDDLRLPTGKASIEITHVTGTFSEARIVRMAPGVALSEGDVIANLVYDPNIKYKFVVYGAFDLSKSGSPTLNDAAIIRRLISQWGGIIEDAVQVDSDFVVVGAEPQIPLFSAEERQDPVNRKKITDAQTELEAYQAVIVKARELNKPILNQNQFLTYVGYLSQVRR